jgi:hypothetical protein
MSKNKCKDTLSYTCGKKVNARCVDYEGDLSDCTELNEDCKVHTLHDTLEDMNEQLTNLCEKVDITGLSGECVDFGLVVTIKGALQTLTNKLCELEGRLPEEGACDPTFSADIACAELNYNCLVDACGVDAAPQDLKELLQIMIDQICVLSAS